MNQRGRAAQGINLSAGVKSPRYVPRSAGAGTEYVPLTRIVLGLAASSNSSVKIAANQLPTSVSAGPSHGNNFFSASAKQESPGYQESEWSGCRAGFRQTSRLTVATSKAIFWFIF